MLKQNKTKEEEREKKIFGDTSHLKCCYQWTWYSWMELAITRICAYFCAEYHVEMALKKTFPQNIQCEWKLNTRFITFNRLISSVEGFWASAMRYRAQWSGEKKRHRSRFVAACSPNDAVFFFFGFCFKVSAEKWWHINQDHPCNALLTSKKRKKRRK